MCYKESTTEMATTQSKDGRRFDEEFKREVAALASKPGAKQEQVARDLGVSPYSGRPLEKAVRQRACGFCLWRQRGRTGGAHPFAGAREHGPREQRTILKKAVAIFSEPPR